MSRAEAIRHLAEAKALMDQAEMLSWHPDHPSNEADQANTYIAAAHAHAMIGALELKLPG